MKRDRIELLLDKGKYYKYERLERDSNSDINLTSFNPSRHLDRGLWQIKNEEKNI